MTESGQGEALPELGATLQRLTPYERNVFVELALRMTRLEVLNLLEDKVWMTTMPRVEKLALLNKPSHGADDERAS